MSPRRYTLGKRAAAVGEVRRRIIEATVALHAERGILATSMRDVARRADVAVGTVYRHFPTADDLVLACGEQVRTTMQVPGPGIFPGALTLFERIDVLVRELFAFYERGAAWLRVGRSERHRVPALEAGQRNLEAQLRSLVGTALGRSIHDDLTVQSVAAITDFGVYHSLRKAGIPTGIAAELIRDVVLASVADRDRTETAAAVSTRRRRMQPKVRNR